jgi:ribose 5-phosphate isomerase
VLEERIRRIVGVVECGLFVGLTDVVFMGHAAGVTRLERSLPVPADR